jgi:hypothetical protein
VSAAETLEAAIAHCVRTYESAVRANAAYHANPAFDVDQRNAVSSTGYEHAEAKERLFEAIRAAREGDE